MQWEIWSWFFDWGLLFGFSLLAIIGWIANVLGLPGNWLVVAMAALCFWFVPESKLAFVGGIALGMVVFAAVLGEVLEFLAGALGASSKGGSKRGTALAMGGSIAGAMAGLLFGNVISVPIAGPLVASLILGALGAFGGATVGERWAGKEWDESFEIGNAAFWGRLLGTVGKAACGSLAAAVFLFALWW